ncbi:hypothetical protein [Streptomyces sp. NPDC054794]
MCGLEFAGLRGVGDGVQPLKLHLGQAGEAGDGAQDVWRGEGVQVLAGDRDTVTMSLGEQCLDGGGVAHPNPVSNDCPRRRLVRRVEADRPQAGELLHETGDDRVGIGQGRITGSADVQGQDAGDMIGRPLPRTGTGLCRCGVGVEPVGRVERDVGVHWAGPARRRPVLAYRCGDSEAAVVRGEGKPEHSVAACLVAGGGEALEEAQGGGERERAARGEDGGGHGQPPWTVSR